MKVFALIVLVIACTAFAQDTSNPSTKAASPRIVAKVVLMNQSAPIPTTTALAAPDGLYRISGYTELTKPGSCNQSWTVTFQWADDNGLHPPALFNSFNCGLLTSGGNAIIVHALPGMPLTFSVTGDKNSSSEYALFFTVERLM